MLQNITIFTTFLIIFNVKIIILNRLRFLIILCIEVITLNAHA